VVVKDSPPIRITEQAQTISLIRANQGKYTNAFFKGQFNQGI
jgi:hypothetical protein